MEWLRNGSHGDEVRELQQKLSAKGVNPGPIDGAFGPKTEAAVRRFQEQNGLQVDGIVGPQTFTALGMMEAQETEATEVAATDESGRDDGFKAKSKIISPSEGSAGDAKNKAEAVEADRKAMQEAADAKIVEEKKAEAAAEAMTEAVEDAGDKASGGGFKAKIREMMGARKARKRDS